MFKGPVGPDSGRTGRSQAEQIGTDPAGFKDGPKHDPKAGIPVTPEFPQQQYRPTPMSPPTGGQQAGVPAPFTITNPGR